MSPRRGSPSPRIVTGQAPSRWRWRWSLPLLVLLSGASGFLLGRAGGHAERGGTGAVHRALEAADARRDALQRELAIARRGSQITDSANEALRRQILDLEGEVAELRDDVAFYQRLLAAGGRRGLAVHSLELLPGVSPRVYRFRLVLSQNLARTRQVAGRWGLTLTGLAAGEMRELAGEELGLLPDGGDNRFAFKYFQELGGSLQLPVDFVPESLRVRLEPAGDRDPVIRVFEWQQAAAPESGPRAKESASDVQPET